MVLFVLLLGLQAGPALQERFLDLERRIISGFHEQDATRLDALLADAYVLRGRPDVDRETWIRNAVTLCWGDRSDIEEFSAREAGGAVIASFVLIMYQDPGTCQPATIRSLITSVWIERNGEWLLTLRHSGPIGEAGADPIAQQFFRQDPPPARWEGTSELSFVSTGGNADVQTIGIGSQVFYRPGVWETAANAVFVRSVAEGIESARSLTAQVRQSAQISPRFDLFVRSGYRRDVFSGIEHRGAVDGGLGYQVISAGRHRLKIDSGFGYLAEQRALGPTLTSTIVNSVKTWRWQILETVLLTNNAAFTALLQETEDWRLNNQFAVTTSLTSVFSLKLSHTTNYLNRPVSGFGRTDTILAAALVARFERR